jgi:hypothetical protein
MTSSNKLWSSRAVMAAYMITSVPGLCDVAVVGCDICAYRRLGAGIAQLVELTADANLPEPKTDKRVPG